MQSKSVLSPEDNQLNVTNCKLGKENPLIGQLLGC